MEFLRIFKRLDIRISIELWALFTAIYYWMYIYLIKFSSDFCKITNYYCIEFLPYGDFLACYIAIVGLYFVVSSIDAWKHQDKYSSAKKNIEKLHTIEDKVRRFKEDLMHLNSFNMNNSSLPITLNVDKDKAHTDAYYKYMSLKSSYKIDNLLNDAEESILNKSVNLEQNKFSTTIETLKKYINNIENKIKKEDERLIKEFLINKEDAKNKIKKIKDKINKNENFEEKKQHESQLRLIESNSVLSFMKDNYIFKFGNGEEINYQRPKCRDIIVDKILEILNQENNLFLKYENNLKDLQKKLNGFVE